MDGWRLFPFQRWFSPIEKEEASGQEARGDYFFACMREYIAKIGQWMGGGEGDSLAFQPFLRPTWLARSLAAIFGKNLARDGFQLLVVLGYLCKRCASDVSGKKNTYLRCNVREATYNRQTELLTNMMRKLLFSCSFQSSECQIERTQVKVTNTYVPTV